MSAAITTFPAPPAHLRERVHGAGDVTSFQAVGACAADDIAGALGDFDRYMTVLDFGCGCGRVLRYMREKMPHARFHAADIDREAIDWVRRMHPDVTAYATLELPPLSYPDATFDLVYAVSVWTHLDESRQHAWLAEIRRILRPGGVLVASLHGERAASHMMERATWEEIVKRGFYYTTTDIWRNIFPPWYGLAWHTPEYVARVWGEYFTVRRYLPGALNDNHDLVVCEL